MTDAVYKQALDTVRTTIAGLALAELDTTAMEVRKFPWDERHIHRGITISWDEPRESSRYSSATNQRDLIGYPCIVTIVKGTSQGSIIDLNNIATWRQQIYRAFNRKRLTGFVGTGLNHITCNVEYGKPSLPDKYRDNYDVTQLIVWCWFLEPRT